MADNIKTVTQAIPTVNSTTGFVNQWMITIQVSDGADVPYTKDYSLPIQISNPTKVPTDYTASELIALFPANLDALFAHHKEVLNPSYVKPNEDINDFDVSNLSSGKASKKK